MHATRSTINRIRLAALTCMAVFGASGAFAQASDRSEPGVTAVIQDIVDGNHILFHKKVLDGLGHVSGRHPANPNRFFMSRSLAPGLVTAADIIEYDLDGKAIADERQGYVERYIHAEIYRARPDVKGAVHSHSPAVLPFGVSRTKLRALTQSGWFLGNGVPVFDAMEHGGKLGFLVNTPDLGKALARALGNGWVVLMRAHGDAVAGLSVREAVSIAINTEDSARTQQNAIALGGKVKYMTADEAKSQAAMSRGGTVDGSSRSWQLWKGEADAQSLRK